MDLHQFRCAVAVADHASFTRGAAAMHLTQPALSHAIAKLEAELAEPLFVRLPREVVLTAAGQAFVEQARLALESADRARAVVHDMTDVVTGRLSLIFVRTAVMEVAETFARFRSRYPDVILDAEEPDDDVAVVAALHDGRAELGVLRAAMASRDLVTVRLAKEEWVVAMPGAGRATPDDATLADLAEQPFVVPPAGTRVRTSFDEFFIAKGLVPQIAAESANLLVVLALVQTGVGAAMVPRNLARWIERPGITILPISLAIEHEFVLAHSRRRLTPAAAAYRAMLADG